jgi:O-antigen ligase
MGRGKARLPRMDPAAWIHGIRGIPGALKEWYRVAIVGMLKGGDPVMFVKTISLFYLALIVVPFIMVPGYDTRDPKMGMILLFSMAIGLVSFYYGKLKPFRNIWALLFVGYLLLNFYFSPKPIDLINAAVPNLWSWKPILKMMIFLLMWITVASLDFSLKDKRQLFTCMIWVGAIMSIYVLLQFKSIDQFCQVYRRFGGENHGASVGTGGALGNRTIVSPFIAMIIPMALYMRSWWKAALMAAAVLATRSQMAIGAMVVSLAFLYSTMYKKAFYGLAAAAVIVLLILIIGFNTNATIHNFIDDGTRFAAWSQMIEDWRSPLIQGKDNSYALTGYGIGSFRYVWPNRHPGEIGANFLQAHNDYIQVLYECGIVGLLLMLAAIVQIFRDQWPFHKLWRDEKKKHRIYLLASFFCISLAALGSFVWQMAPIILYTIVVVGLMQNRGAPQDDETTTVSTQA